MKQFFLEKSILFHTIFTVFIVYVLIVSHFTTAYGDNAPPFIFTLRQPDGVEFSARVFGNEWYHWVETLDGFTIRKNPVNGFWEYLERTASGGLVLSGRQVVRDAPAGLEMHLRDLELMRIAREKQSELFAEYLRKTGAAKVTVQGTGKPLVIMVDFTGGDHFQHKYSRSQFDDMLFSQGTYPTGSMNDYYREVSRGVYSVRGNITDWATAPNSYAYYCDNQSGMGDWPKNSQGLVYDIVTALDSQIDFSQYDTNGDGYVDGITLIVEGEYNQTNDNRFWAHAWALNTHRVQLDGVWINKYNVVNEQTPQGNMRAIGTFCHEWGHILGLPDLYDYTYVSEGIGEWGLMGSGNWNTQESPAHLCAWSKLQLGWVNPINVTTNLTNFEIRSVNQYGTVYRLWTYGIQGDEYFLVENRQAVGFDNYLKGTGLLIWHIDDNQKNNDNYLHKMVDLEEADGEDDLDFSHNRGDAGDPFPGSGGLRNPNTTFDNASYPNSNNYLLQNTSVKIYNISASSSSIYANLSVGQSNPTIVVTATFRIFGNKTVGTTDSLFFYVKNTGDLVLSVTSIGGLTAPFSVTPTSIASINKNDSVRVKVTFSPTVSGAKKDTVVIVSNDPVNPTKNVIVLGTGQTNPTIVVTSTALNFGNKTIGTTDSLFFYVKNTGDLALSVTSISGLAAPFSVTPTSIASISKNDSAKVKVTFSPTVSGAKTDTVVIVSNDPLNPTKNVIVQGTGQKSLVLVVNPTSYDFGNKVVTTTDSVSIKVKNTGDQQLTVSSMTGLMVPFSFSPASIGPLNKNDSVTVKIYFIPTESGVKIDTLIITSNVDTVNVVVQGNGQTRQSIGVKPTSLDFGLKNTDTQTQLTFKVTNNGDLALGVSSIGGLVPPFSVNPMSIATINKGDSVTVIVTFNPTISGIFRETVVIASNDPVNPTVNIIVSGAGQTNPTIVLTPPILNFGDKTVGTTDSLFFYVKNTGDIALSVTSIGGLTASFSVTRTRIDSVNKNDSVKVKVTFSPTQTGAFLDTVVIISNDPVNVTKNVIVSGIGCASPPRLFLQLTRSVDEVTFTGKDSLLNVAGGETFYLKTYVNNIPNFVGYKFKITYYKTYLDSLNITFTDNIDDIEVSPIFGAFSNWTLTEGTGSGPDTLCIEQMQNVTFPGSDIGNTYTFLGRFRFRSRKSFTTSTERTFNVSFAEYYYKPSGMLITKTIASENITSCKINPIVDGVPALMLNPTSYILEQNYPNPFNPQTRIQFKLPNVSYVTIKIYDILGHEVKTVLSEQRGAGTHSVIWDGMNNAGQRVASGIYIYRMQAGSFTAVKRMVLIR